MTVKNSITNEIFMKCSVEPCISLAKTKGWCKLHYARWYRHGDPTIIKHCDNSGKCKVDDCVTMASRKGFCKLHYGRNLKWGNPNTVKSNLGYERSSTKKAVKSPTIADLYWAAGFCEGEATFCYAKYSQSAKIPQTDNLDSLKKMLDLFGGSISKKRAVSKSGFVNSRPQRVWQICGSRARGFMMTIYSLMSKRRKKQIRKALER